LTERLITFTRRAQQRLRDAERWPELMRGHAFGRAAKPEEIAWTAAVLASDKSAYTTGLDHHDRRRRVEPPLVAIGRNSTIVRAIRAESQKERLANYTIAPQLRLMRKGDQRNA
jgi:hypothetical protein